MRPLVIGTEDADAVRRMRGVAEKPTRLCGVVPMSRAARSGIVVSMEELITPAPLFTSVLCGADIGASGIATRRQAAWLAGPTGAVELVQRDLTDRILGVVSDRVDVTRVAELAARMVRRHRAAVAFVAAPGPSRDLDRALAATSRIMLRTAGVTPRVMGVPAPLDLAVQEAAAAAGSSLLVMGVGAGAWDVTLACDVARRAGCSVLTVAAATRDFHRSSPAARSTALVAA